MKQIHSFSIFRNVALSYSELLMIITSRDFYVLDTLVTFLLHYEPKRLWNLETVLNRDGRLPVG